MTEPLSSMNSQWSGKNPIASISLAFADGSFVLENRKEHKPEFPLYKYAYQQRENGPDQYGIRTQFRCMGDGLSATINRWRVKCANTSCLNRGIHCKMIGPISRAHLVANHCRTGREIHAQLCQWG